MKYIPKNILLVIVLLFGMALRFYGLGEESIWIDEGITAEVSHIAPIDMYERLKGDTHPVLYFFILHYCVELFGDSEFALRLLSVVFSSFSIIMIYLVGKQLFDDKVGLLSALILSLSLYHIQYAQEARPYALAVMLTLCSFYFFNHLRIKPKILTFLAYVFSSALLLYSHNLTICILVAQNIFIITLLLIVPQKNGVNIFQWILSQICILILYIPWLPVLLRQLNLVSNDFWIQTPTLLKTIQTFRLYASYSVLLSLLFFILSIYAVLHLKPLIKYIHKKDIFGSRKIFSYENNLLRTDTLYLLILWLLTPIVLPYIISLISSPIFIYRNTIPASLSLYILVAFGVRKINRKSIQLLVLILIIIIPLIMAWKEYYTKQNKENWRGVAEYLDENARTGDLLLFYPGWIQNLTFNYYSKRTDIDKMAIRTNTADVILNGKKTNINQFISNYKRIWIILYKEHRNHKLIEEIEKASFQMSYSQNRVYEHYEFRGNIIESIHLLLFVRDPKIDMSVSTKEQFP